MHPNIREGLLLALLVGALMTPAGAPAARAAISAAPDCAATGHLIGGPTVNRDPNWITSDLRAVAVAGPGDVWAVGSATVYDFSPRAGAAGSASLRGYRYDPPQPAEPPRRTSALIEHWSGTAWQPVPNPASGAAQAGDTALNALAVIDPQDIWAVGAAYNSGDRTSRPLIEHWDGRAWAIVAPPPAGGGAGLSRVAASGPADVWVAGATAAHWDGHTWQEAPVPLPPGTQATWLGLGANAPADAWIAATLIDLNGVTAGMLLARWDGRAWTAQTTPVLPPRTTLRAVVALGPRDVWAAGSIDSPPGPVPTTVPALPTPGPADPGAPNPLDGVGPLLLHWDGSAWSRVPAPAGYQPQSLIFAGAGDGWAAGLDQRVNGEHFGLLHWDGTRWTPAAVTGRDEPFAYPDQLYGLAAEGPADLWAVGSGHLDGRTSRDRLSIVHIFRDCAVPTAPAADPQDPAVSYFPATGHTLRGLFRDYWTAHGGLAQFGYPLTDEYPERNATDGRIYKVQYFERNRFELHPENAGTPYVVLLGLLGRSLAATPGYEAGSAFDPVHSGPPGARFFPATGHSLAPELRAYWEGHGGLAVYGYPISEPFLETSSTDGNTYLVQYFERNRLELHPELPADFRVSLGLLGVDLLRSRGWLR